MPTARDALLIYVITYGTRDYGGKYVVRDQAVLPGGEIRIAPHPRAVCDTLEEARRAVPPGVVRLQAFQDDDPAIVETWI
jgi:hypothetical protein